MNTRGLVAIYTGASALWAMAVLGAIGVAHWLGMSSRDTILLVIAVAVLAIFGTFIPAVELGMTRAREAREKQLDDRERTEPEPSKRRG